MIDPSSDKARKEGHLYPFRSYITRVLLNNRRSAVSSHLDGSYEGNVREPPFVSDCYKADADAYTYLLLQVR